MESSRLPGKVLSKIGQYSVLELIFKRLSRSRYIDSIILATSENQADTLLIEQSAALNLKYFRGSQTNVLERTVMAASQFKADRVVRITADCPFVDPEIIDTLLLCSNLDPESDFVGIAPGFPDGLDSSVILTSALNIALSEAKLPSDLEHTAPYIEFNRNGLFNVRHINIFSGVHNMRITLDEKEDLEVLQNISQLLNDMNIDPVDVASDHLVSLWKSRPDIFKPNNHIIRNQGYLTSLKNDQSLTNN